MRRRRAHLRVPRLRAAARLPDHEKPPLHRIAAGSAGLLGVVGVSFGFLNTGGWRVALVAGGLAVLSFSLYEVARLLSTFRAAQALMAMVVAGGWVGFGLYVATLVPEPSGDQLAPPNYSVSKIDTIDMGSGVPARAVYSSRSHAGITSTDLRILRWDSSAKRWNLAFDAQDAPSGFDGPPLLPRDVNSSVGSLLPLVFYPGDGRQFVFDFTVTPGNHTMTEIGVIDETARGVEPVLVQSYQGDVTVTPVGVAPNQKVQLTAGWYTDVDPACCPLRQFHQTLAYRSATGQDSAAIAVVTDDRPYLGAQLVSLNAGQRDSWVASVDNDSPASKAGLQPGDEILDVDGVAAPGENAIDGPSLVDVLAMRKAGDAVVLHIWRAGRTYGLPVHLGSVNDPIYSRQAALQTPSAEVPFKSSLGIVAADGSAGSAHGAYVNAVVAGGPSEIAGIPVKSLITAVNGATVASAAEIQGLEIALMQNMTALVDYIDPFGQSQEVSVILGPPDSTEAAAYLYPT